MLRNLMSSDTYSFTELAESLPQLSDKVLTERLSELVSGGLVERAVANGFPRRTEYRITKRGEELRPLLIELYRTGMALQAHDTTAEGREVEQGDLIATLQPRRIDGDCKNMLI